MNHAARVTDPHTCPVNTPSSHIGGQIQGPGVPTIRIGYLPAAVQGTICTCAGIIPNPITKGSSTVKLGHQPAARAGDATAHGGSIVCGCATVMIGG